jgi:hypothetical protein
MAAFQRLLGLATVHRRAPYHRLYASVVDCHRIAWNSSANLGKTEKG